MGYSKNVCLLIIVAIGLGIYWINHRIEEHHLASDPMLYKIKDLTKSLHPDIRNIKLFRGSKSYTINKNKIYVFLHEFSHYLNKDDVGHTEKFHEIFRDLILKAHFLGIYDISIPPLKKYCMHT